MDDRPIDLNLLATLDVLLGEGRVSAAARRMGLSQPAMSARLSKLRALFDDPLLVSSGRRMVPTVRAEEIVGALRPRLHDLEALVRERGGFDPATSTATFRLGGTDYAHAVLSRGLVGHLRGLAPEIRLALMPFDRDRLWRDLEEGVLDAAVVTTFVTVDEAKARFLWDEDFVLVQRRGHPRGAVAPDLDAFCALDHVLVSPAGGGFVGAVDQALETKGRQRRLAASLPHFLLALDLIASTDLVAVLPARLARERGAAFDILALPLEVAGFGVQLIWHPRRQNDPAHVWFRREIAGYATRPS